METTFVVSTWGGAASVVPRARNDAKHRTMDQMVSHNKELFRPKLSVLRLKIAVVPFDIV